MLKSKESMGSNGDGDFEKAGYLQKKTSKGMWVTRYFATDRNQLQYWHNQAQYDRPEAPAESYDVSEIRSIDMVGSRGFVLSFYKTNKFKVEIAANSEQERTEWRTIIDAKRRLYSVDELLADISASRIVFHTKTFQTLMALQEKDQNKWMLDRLDEAYEISHDSTRSDRLRADSSQLLLASIRVLDEFLLVCGDCEEEIASRCPKVIAHTRYFEM